MSEQVEVASAHFVGIGGAGMSGIALVLHQRGCRVSGSDLKASHYVRELEEAGIDARVGHNGALIDEIMPSVVVTSTAIPDTNPEVVRARELGIAVWPRARMLSWLSGTAQTVAVAGTHGKTTTSSMVATMLDRMGLDPSFLIGGIVEGYNTNGHNGFGDHFVCEADESDGSFMFLSPHIAVITNIEADHLDHYGDLATIEDTFASFMGLVDDEGTVVVNGDAPRPVELARSTGRRVLTYGLDSTCDVVCIPGEKTSGLASSFVVRLPDASEVSITLQASPGVHNMVNATAGVAVALALGLSAQDAAVALSQFRGARRRFTLVGEVDSITVVDDYGHHPTEVEATLRAASALDFSRIVCVFQPHRYSRTQALAKEFGGAFAHADAVRVMDVFPAGEMPIPGVSGRTIAQEIEGSQTVSDVVFVPHRRDLVERLASELRAGDLLMTMGAGDVTTLGPDVLAALRERTGGASV